MLFLGGPLLNSISLCIVSCLQQGHCNGLYFCNSGFVINTGFTTAGNCALINVAAFNLPVLLSMPKCLMRTSPFGSIPLD